MFAVVGPLDNEAARKLPQCLGYELRFLANTLIDRVVQGCARAVELCL